MVALEHHHDQSPRTRWKALHRASRIVRHAHDGRAEVWRWISVGLLAFWGLFAYAIHSI